MPPVILMHYIIWLSNKAEYDRMISLAFSRDGILGDGTGSIQIAPQYFVDNFGIPFPTIGGENINSDGMRFIEPYIPGREIAETGITLTIDTLFFRDPDVADYVWAANIKFNYQPNAVFAAPASHLNRNVDVPSTSGVTLLGATTFALLGDISGIYQLMPNKTHDTYYDRQAGLTTMNRPIPNPRFKTGYIGG